MARVCVAFSSRRDLLIGGEILNRALADQQDREYQRQRQQHVKRDSRQIDPGVADLCAVWRAKPRIRAMATTIPVAADKKFCTFSASTCVR